MKGYSLKSLTEKYNLSLDAASINIAMVKIGILENCEYESTTGSGEIKTFLCFSETGLKYGKNQESSFHDFKTSCRFYKETFGELLLLVVEQIRKEAELV